MKTAFLVFVFSMAPSHLRGQAPKIILDTDMGSDCDDVGAMAILHQYVKEKQAVLLGVVYSSGRVPHGVGVIDAINTYFTKPDIPIGAEMDTLFGDPSDKMDAQKLALDKDAFGHDLVISSDADDKVALVRRLLNNEHDNSVTYLTIGHTKGLYDVLQSVPDSISTLTGWELVKKKVQRWVALGGLRADNPDIIGAKDWNFFRNGTQIYTDYLLEHFPKPVFIINAGSDVITGQPLAFSDAGNIVRTAYRDWLWNVEKKVLSQGRPSWDLAAVCFAVEKDAPFFETPKRGTLHFDVEHGSKWESHKNGSHFYVNQKKGCANSFAKHINKLLKKAVGESNR